MLLLKLLDLTHIVVVMWLYQLRHISYAITQNSSVRKINQQKIALRPIYKLLAVCNEHRCVEYQQTNWQHVLTRRLDLITTITDRAPRGLTLKTTVQLAASLQARTLLGSQVMENNPQSLVVHDKSSERFPERRIVGIRENTSSVLNPQFNYNAQQNSCLGDSIERPNSHARKADNV